MERGGLNPDSAAPARCSINGGRSSIGARTATPLSSALCPGEGLRDRLTALAPRKGDRLALCHQVRAAECPRLRREPALRFEKVADHALEAGELGQPGSSAIAPMPDRGRSRKVAQVRLLPAMKEESVQEETLERSGTWRQRNRCPRPEFRPWAALILPIESAPIMSRLDCSMLGNATDTWCLT